MTWATTLLALLGLVFTSLASLTAFGQEGGVAADRQTYVAVQEWRGEPPEGQLRFPRGIAVDRQGNIYVADMGHARIQKFSSSGALITTWGRLDQAEGGFVQPRAVAIGPDGSVYVADTLGHRVERFGPAGDFIQQFGEYGSEDGQFRYPSGIAVSPEGFVYVADTVGHRIQKFDASGHFLSKWGRFGHGPGDLAWPGAIALDSKGDVYVADTENHRIQRFGPDGQFIQQWGQSGEGPGHFTHLGGIAVDGNGFVFVSDTFTHRVQKFDQQGLFVSEWGTLGSGDGQLKHPGELASAGNSVYVSDTGNHRVQQFDTSGRFVGYLGEPVKEDYRLLWPAGLATAATGEVYVLDAGTGRVAEWDPSSGSVSTVGQTQDPEEELGCPLALAVGPDGSTYIADTCNHRVQVFDADGEFAFGWGRPGEGDGEFNEPMGIAFGPDDAVYVADTGNDRIQKFDVRGGFLGRWGQRGNANGEFHSPRSIAVSSDGAIYVADSGNQRIQKFSPDGEFLHKWGGYGTGPGEFAGPMGVAVDRDGFVYVADHHNHRVQKFDPDGRPVTTWGRPGKSPGQFRGPSAVAVGDNGDVYVADMGNGRVQRFAPARHTLYFPLGLSRSSAARGPSSITEPADDLVIRADTILRPGTYLLDDLADDGALIIGADGITLDCNGATLQGRDNRGFGIYNPGHHAVTIKNCHIHGYYYAIRSEGANALQIIDNDLSGNRTILDDRLWANIGQSPQIDYDSHLGGGIFLRNSTGNMIARNLLNDQQNGLDLYTVTHTTIMYNEISDNRGWGIHLDESSGNTIAYNTADRVDRNCAWSWADERCGWGGLDVAVGCGCDSAAIMLTRASDDNTIIGNSLKYSGDGLFSGPATGWACSTRNLIARNDGSYSPHNAFEFTFCPNNTLIGNTANYSDYGFWLGYSYDSALRDNAIVGNMVGIAIEHGRGNVIADNLISGNQVLGIALWTDYDELFLQVFPEARYSRNYTIQANTLQQNRVALGLGGTTDSQIGRNRFVDNAIGIRLSASTIQTETVGSIANTIQYNNLECVTAGAACVYHLHNEQPYDAPAQHNWWGSPEPSAIESTIYDQRDDPSLGIVDYVPFLTTPVEGEELSLAAALFRPEPPFDSGPEHVGDERWAGRRRARP